MFTSYEKTFLSYWKEKSVLIFLVALRGTKISINNWIKAQFSSLFEVSLAAELQSMAHMDYAEGVAAAIEKRSPDFE